MHDPTDPVGRLLSNVLAVVAEFEADLISLRTRAPDDRGPRQIAAAAWPPDSGHGSRREPAALRCAALRQFTTEEVHRHPQQP
jgi:DNA invertase Pin-like site-specific DNA recombinase